MIIGQNHPAKHNTSEEHFIKNTHVRLFLCVQATVSGSGEFQIQLTALVNEDWMTEDGHCCSSRVPGDVGVKQPVCSTPCQTFFHICLSNNQANLNPLQAKCTFGNMTTVVLKETDQRGTIGHVRRLSTATVASSGHQQFIDSALSIKFDFTWPVRIFTMCLVST